VRQAGTFLNRIKLFELILSIGILVDEVYGPDYGRQREIAAAIRDLMAANDGLSGNVGRSLIPHAAAGPLLAGGEALEERGGIGNGAFQLELGHVEN
jgi:hypothetical protein